MKTMERVEEGEGIEERYKGPALVVAVCVVGIILMLAPTLLDLLF